MKSGLIIDSCCQTVLSGSFFKRKRWLNPCLGPSTFRRRQEDIFPASDGARLNHRGRRLLTNHFHEVFTNTTIDGQTTSDLRRLDSHRANWYDEYAARIQTGVSSVLSGHLGFGDRGWLWMQTCFSALFYFKRWFLWRHANHLFLSVYLALW